MQRRCADGTPLGGFMGKREPQTILKTDVTGL